MAKFKCIKDKQSNAVTVEISGENIKQLNPQKNMDSFQCADGWKSIETSVSSERCVYTFVFNGEGCFEDAVVQFVSCVHKHLVEKNPNTQEINMHVVEQKPCVVPPICGNFGKASLFALSGKKKAIVDMELPPPEVPIKISLLSDESEFAQGSVLISVEASSLIPTWRSKKAACKVCEVAKKFADKISFLDIKDLSSIDKSCSYRANIIAHPKKPKDAKKFIEDVVSEAAIALEDDGFKSKEFKINIGDLVPRYTPKPHPASWPGTPKGEAHNRRALFELKASGKDQQSCSAKSKKICLFVGIKAQVIAVRKLIAKIESNLISSAQYIEDLEKKADAKKMASEDLMNIKIQEKDKIDFFDHESYICNTIGLGEIYSSYGKNPYTPLYKYYEARLKMDLLSLTEKLGIFDQKTLKKMTDIEIAEKVFDAKIVGQDGELAKLIHTREVFECPKDFKDSYIRWEALLKALIKLNDLAKQVKQQYICETAEALFTP